MWHDTHRVYFSLFAGWNYYYRIVIDSYASVVKYIETAEPHKWTLVHSTGQPHAHGEITQRMLDLIEQNRRDIDKLSRALHD